MSKSYPLNDNRVKSRDAKRTPNAKRTTIERKRVRAHKYNSDRKVGR